MILSYIFIFTCIWAIWLMKLIITLIYFYNLSTPLWQWFLTFSSTPARLREWESMKLTTHHGAIDKSLNRNSRLCGSPLISCMVSEIVSYILYTVTCIFWPSLVGLNFYGRQVGWQTKVKLFKGCIVLRWDKSIAIFSCQSLLLSSYYNVAT